MFVKTFGFVVRIWSLKHPSACRSPRCGIELIDIHSDSDGGNLDFRRLPENDRLIDKLLVCLWEFLHHHDGERSYSSSTRA